MTFIQAGRVGLSYAGRPPRLAILRPDNDLLRLLDADHAKERSYSQSCRDWPEIKSHLAILLAPPDRLQGDGSGGEQVERIWGLGIVRPAHETDRDRKVVVAHARRLRTLVPASGLWDVGSGLDAALSKSLPESGPVAVGADAVLSNLLRTSPDVEAEVMRLMPLLDEAEGWSDGELRWRDERDALLLFAKIAGLAPNDFSEVRFWDKAPAHAAFIGGLVGNSVQPMLDDLRGRVAARFSGNGESVVRSFTSRGVVRSYDFEVTSITSQWVMEGGQGSLDAYYYHVESGTLVVLRYLRPGPNGLFLSDVRHGLEEFQDRVRQLGVWQGADGYSLLADPLFLRVHEPVPFTSALHRTSPGAIYPYGQVTAAIAAAGSTGSPGPSVSGLTRHLVPTDFARMVRDGWFGASRVSPEAALDWLDATIETAGIALVVLDFSLRQRGNGSGIRAQV